MKKITFLILTTCLLTQINAQSFVEITDTPFDGVNYASIAIADIDNDNDLDILIAGANNSGRSAKLYTNELGVFTEIEGTFLDDIHSYSAVTFADIDNDGDQDLLVTALSNGFQEFTTLYTNDGEGNFNEIPSNIGNVIQGGIAFADIDNDNDLDLLITGYSESGNSGNLAVAKLYKNDGNGVFTEVIETPFDGVSNSSIAFADIDNDNDLDVLIIGWNNLSHKTAKLYTNDGSGAFVEVEGTPFEGAMQGSLAFADVDNDNDMDVFITGKADFSNIAVLYINDGTGSFTEDTDTPFDGVFESSIAFADVDNDNDMDLMITGKNPLLKSIMYINDGAGTFSEALDMPFDNVVRSAIAFADFDSDNDLDLLITGYSVETNGPNTTLYENTMTPVGLTEIDLGLSFSIYPNPVQDVFTLELNQDIIDVSNKLDLIVYDSFGRTVQTIHAINRIKTQVNISQLHSGLYLYKLISNREVVANGKIIKN